MKFRPLLVIVALGVLLRFAHLLAVAPTPILSYHHTFRESDMYMFDQWARRIANGDVLGREVYHPVVSWQLDAAPLPKWTAWYGESPVFYKAPLYPYLIAGLYRISDDAMVALAMLQILAGGLSIVLLSRVVSRMFGEFTGLLSALIYAVYAPDIHYDVVMLRGPWIILVSLLATWQLVELHALPHARRALALGATVGIALLINEGFFAVLPLVFLLLIVWFPAADRLVALTCAFAVGVTVAVAPLVIRNVVVGAPALKLSVTGSTVYAVFNSAGASPYFFQVRPATFVPIIEQSGGSLLATVIGCLRSFGHVRDVAVFYLQKTSGLAIPFENPDNANFYYAALKSPLLTILPNYALLFPVSVVGLGLAIRKIRAWLPLLPFSMCLFVSILLTLPLSRYRATFAVYLIPFAAFALVEAARCLRSRRLLAVGAMVVVGVLTFLTAGLLEDRVAFAGIPRGYYYYRPVEFFLGAEVYERQGRFAEGAQEALNLAELNPHAPTKALAFLVMARLEARRGDSALAGRALADARQLDGANPWLLQAVGDVYLHMLGDRVAAADCFRQATKAGPPETLRRALEEQLQLLEGPRVK